MYKLVILAGVLLFSSISLAAQHSVAREWNELLLEAIRGDLARPTVHARNLFHTSVAMYDAWALYDSESEPFFVGKTVGNYTCPTVEVPATENIRTAQETALSYAVYRLLRHRFAGSPGAVNSIVRFDNYMVELGYDPTFMSTDVETGGAAALGNFIAAQLIAFGFQDGANEQFGYANLYYQPSNPPLVVAQSGNPDVLDPNRWQPLTLDIFIDQSGNEIPFNTPPFLSPEWGRVVPFSMPESMLDTLVRDGQQWWVYHDPGEPSYLQADGGGTSAEYQWGHSLVAIWSAHLDPSDGVLWDISPGAAGNIAVADYPATLAGLRDFYDLENGGDIGRGHALNPVTGAPYPPNIVHRGDYTRVLAEFWADGPDSETPPGHWFTILNYVNDHPELRRQFGGQGEVLDELEWDLKSYLALGGAMHDVAISVWGIKGYYDYARPISAIRYMADLGQSTDTNLPNYHPAGIPLLENYIEVVGPADPLAGPNGEHVNKIKLRAWRGPDYINIPQIQTAGVGWILAENWWPYQRPSFVTPNFAGYVSGHSTYSRAAAEILTALTGDPFFPGGVGIFDAARNEFLVFEDGPSTDIHLEWATYRDASDQCSLSRIWGGIHPPVDDIPGRLIGIEIGGEAFALAESLFYKDQDGDGFYSYEDCDDEDDSVYPNAPEICDEKDNDCNGETDEGVQLVFYADLDADGFGTRADSIMACIAPADYVLQPGDCDDMDALAFPGQLWYLDVDGDGYSSTVSVTSCLRPEDGFLATELIAVGTDCDDENAEAFPGQIWYLDADGDNYSDGTSFTACARPENGFLPRELRAIEGDCDDSTAAVAPGVQEICDGLDNDCNGLIDDELPLFSYYRDGDGDGFGNPEFRLDTCLTTPPISFVTNDDDCNDGNSRIYPNAVEIADNGVDEDCNGTDLFQETRVFPNPFRDQLFLHLAEAARVRVQLYDMQGRLAWDNVQLLSNNRLEMELSSLQPGVYLLVVREEQGGRVYLQQKVLRL